MENLTFNSNKLLDTTNFVRVGDLSYFEGPLLSLFEELNSGHIYLFDWVDRDQKFNRWLIYRVSPKHLLQFINCKISHFELFEKRPDKKVFFTDIDSNNKSFFYYDSFELSSLPLSYYPNRDNFFEISDSTSFEKIKSVIINSLSRQKTENEYSTVYNIRVFKRNEVKLIYFNHVQTSYKSSLFPVRQHKFNNIGMLESLVYNSLQNRYFKANARFKTQESKNKKEYANQYN